MADEATRRVVAELPLLKTNAGPRDRELWVQRLKEEYQALIKYVENNKNADNDWFRLESNKEGTRFPLRTRPPPPKSPFQSWMGKRPRCTAGPVAGSGDPGPDRQGAHRAQGEMRGSGLAEACMVALDAPASDLILPRKHSSQLALHPCPQCGAVDPLCWGLTIPVRSNSM
uniref:Ubiquitin-fold modifier-conjugating enzyme 1 n=1 Tax=Gopherus agassizii TaxID=38772 RepID=A0A452GFJ0_9SAUR